MDHSRDLKHERRIAVWGGTALMLATVALGIWVGRAPTVEAAWSGALVVATGIFAMAWCVSRVSPVPPWGWWGTATGMVAVLLLGVGAGGAAHWPDQRDGVWMLPWYLLLIGTVPARATGWCAATGTRGGWVLMVTGMLLAAITMFAPLVL